MTLDQALVAPVSHYIGGMIGAAITSLFLLRHREHNLFAMVKEELEVTGRLNAVNSQLEGIYSAGNGKMREI